MEGSQRGSRIGKIIRVIPFGIQQDGNRREEGEKGIAIFAGLKDKRLSPSPPIAVPMRRECRPHRHCGVTPDRGKKRAKHRRNRAFSVRPRHPDTLTVREHQSPQKIGTGHKRNPPPKSRLHLGMIFLHGN